jgi:small-conductance mechanosensitive channel
VELWERLVVVAVVLAVSAAVARLIDRAIARRTLAPGSVTRYRVLRRGISTGVTVVGILSALLVIPQIRAVAGGLLASSAVVGIVVGFASQRTIGNFVAGILIAFTQPVRIGDRVTVGGTEGVVEEIGLTYTFIRTHQAARLVIPNEKLASDTILNATIVNPEKLAEITVNVPLDTDLAPVLETLRGVVADERRGDVFVSALDGNAAFTVRAWADDEAAAERLESELRLRAHARLRAAGIFA